MRKEWVVNVSSSNASPLLTDLYQLTMMDAYYRLGMEQLAVFEFFVRRLPDRRNFLVAAGLEQVLDYLESLHFSDSDLAWLDSTRRFSPTLLERLQKFKFSGHVYALPEGTVFFANEPVVRIEAPLPQAQLVESRIVNLLQYQILVASKAARCRISAQGTQLIDFGMRRAHGAEAALFAARAGFIAGVDATATVESSRRFGMPAVGTMAHSFIQAHDLELEAFRNFAACEPENLVLLIDTYDTQRGALRIVELAKALRKDGVQVKGVRIDSGDLGAEARQVRDILDANGCKSVRIFVSGNVDEYSIEALRRAKAPIDAFCVGTRLAVSADVPALDCAYKLQQYAGRPRAKRSPLKETWPGPHQVYRQYDPHGRIAMDMLACADEIFEGKALLRETMIHGQRTCPSPSLQEVRELCAEELATLPMDLRALEKAGQPPTKVSERLHALAAEVAETPR
jgi:nicotinate phosphoribosyltransferase